MKRCYLFALLLVAVPASATDAGACYSIADHDARAYCLAKSHGDAGRCYAIHGVDLRSLCLAEVRK